MNGTLCVPAGVTPSTVMVLVPGGTYDEVYWNYTYQPDTYNFRLAMNRSGYATFTLDRLGSGKSSKPGLLGVRQPLSATVTAFRQADAIHHVITKLRAGGIGGKAFSKVIIGGHSLGSAITTIHAANYDDVDAVLLTGISHQVVLQPSTLLETFALQVQPALLDPQFAGQGYDPGYVTLKPGGRTSLFYHEQATTDPGLVAFDEANKGVSSLLELGDGIGVGAVSPYSALIRKPVLIANGDRDRFMCNALTDNCGSPAALRSQEQAFYPLVPCLQTFLLPGVGHNLNLATNAAQYHEAVADWANATIGSGSQTPAPACPPQA